MWCQNKCLHCWRAIELTEGENMDEKEIDDPKKIIDECIKEQGKLIIGFKGNKKINLKKYKEAQEPMQLAISLIGEPMLYPKLGELIAELRQRGKTSFIVTNGLCPDVLKNLGEKGQLPTQLYISLNSPNKEMYEKWHRSSEKNSWEKFNESLEIFSKLKTRRVIRMTLVKDMNMDKKFVPQYVELIKKAMPDFIEVKGIMSVGFSRKRLGYEKMPTHDDIKEFAHELALALAHEGYKILDEHEFSRVVLIGKDKEKMKIKKEEV
jgi:tRNA wybutosine-synthesizing protein 1